MMNPVDVNPSRNRRVALMAGSVAAGMVGLAYASVPLYALFCQVTGFGGTTQRAAVAPSQVNDQTVTVRFDANIAPSLNWSFHAGQSAQTIKFGEQVLAVYKARNLGTELLTGTAVFNVSPPEAGIYFNKIQCFCFTEQTLKPGETVEMPVSYFVDPAMLDNANTKGIREITLSYTFYPAETNRSAALQSN
jgi:cytochrome c oxidase assembly protein subunit 11